MGKKTKNNVLNEAVTTISKTLENVDARIKELEESFIDLARASTIANITSCIKCATGKIPEFFTGDSSIDYNLDNLIEKGANTEAYTNLKFQFKTVFIDLEFAPYWKKNEFCVKLSPSSKIEFLYLKSKLIINDTTFKLNWVITSYGSSWFSDTFQHDPFIKGENKIKLEVCGLSYAVLK
jgi:hypothetical protein